MTYGEYRRTKPRINILRGFRGNEPQSLTFSAKPATGQAIKSGMLIVLNDSGQWVKCDSASHGGKVPYFAYSDDTDTDVVSSGLLLGISCLGDFELQTAYFNTGTTWADGSPVIKGTGSLVGSVDKGASFLAAVETVGVASRGGVEDIAKINSEAVKDGSGKVQVLNLVTRWRPATA
jgi:hypothetical protein